MMKKYIIHILSINAFLKTLSEYDESFSAAILCGDRDVKPQIITRYKQLLWVLFQDIEDSIAPDAFNEKQSEIIAQFIKELPEGITDLYICCTAGESRSPAIAAAILRASGRDDMDVWLNPYYHPNVLVYMKLCKAFGIHSKTWDEDIKALVKINQQAYRDSQNNGGQTKYERWQILG